MEVRLLDKEKDGKVSFVVKGVSSPYANMLRRFMNEEVPVMAIEDVEFRKNNSILYDEMIAHRLGLLPLKTDLKSYTALEDCKCEGKGCARCSLSMTLKARGPGLVLASDLNTKDPKIKPVHPDMPIVKLLKGQDVELEAVAVLGRGRVHTKWGPGRAWYNHKAKITVNNKSSKFEECKELFPPQIFNENNQIDKNLITEFNLIDAVDGVCEDVVKVEYEDNAYVFNIESWEQLSCKDIALTAIDEFQHKLDELAKALK